MITFMEETGDNTNGEVIKHKEVAGDNIHGGDR